MLTRKQHELLMFIHERIKEGGVSPSFDEMKDALDLASKSGIHRLITALEERGFLRRLPHRARALEVVKLPESAAPGRTRTPFRPQVVEGGGQPLKCTIDVRCARHARPTRLLNSPGPLPERCRPPIHRPGESMLGQGIAGMTLGVATGTRQWCGTVRSIDRRQRPAMSNRFSSTAPAARPDH